MARIRLNLKNLTIPEKIAKSRQIASAMTNNSIFANPTPALPDVTARLDQLEKAFGSVQAAKSEASTRVVTQDNAATDVDQILTQLAGYVESVAGRDDTIITSAGMETKASRSTPTTPGEAAGASQARLTEWCSRNNNSFTIWLLHRTFGEGNERRRRYNPTHADLHRSRHLAAARGV